MPSPTAVTVDRAPIKPIGPMQRQELADDFHIRRYESAETSRLNEAHWQTATNQHINFDLEIDLPTLWARCVYEASNNPLIEGVIETHITDMIGENGPSCQIEPKQSKEDSKEWAAYTDEAESFLYDLCETGWDLHGELPLSDMLALWLWSEWTLGDIIGQEVTNESQSGVRVRINPIDPRRLQSPWGMGFGQFGSTNIALGVQRDPTGRRTNYWFTEPKDQVLYSSQARPIDARWIYHDYRRREIGQVRGVPLLGGCLQVVADLRDFDIQVLDAARTAADFAAIAYTTAPEAGFANVNESTPIRRRRISHLPPGWQLTQLTPQHPSTKYIEFRRERLREIGRAVAMPLMTILLDASEHNYSSARMDGQNYQRVLRRSQKRIERKILNRFAYTALQEAEDRGIIRRRPGSIRALWMWDPIPHVDPDKEAKADERQMRNYQLDPYTAARRANREFEVIARRWQRANTYLSSLGLPPVGATIAAPPLPEPVDADPEDQADQKDQKES